MPFSDFLFAIRWWVVLLMISTAVFPLSFHLFHRLPDRGVAFSKPLGLLIISYTFWMFGTLSRPSGLLNANPLSGRRWKRWKERGKTAVLISKKAIHQRTARKISDKGIICGENWLFVGAALVVALNWAGTRPAPTQV